MINLDEILLQIQSDCEQLYLYSDIDDSDAEIISKALSENNTNPNLTEISFRRSKISDYGLNLIMGELSFFPSINSLSFDFCFIKSEGAKSIANLLLSSKRIDKFIFQRNSVTEECWLELSKSAGIHKNECNSWIEIFAPVLAVNKTIKNANLSCGFIDDNAAEILAAALSSNTALEKLDISYSKISDDNMHKLCLAIGKNHTLKKIIARFCGDPRPDVHDDGEAAYQFHSIASETLKSQTKRDLIDDFGFFELLASRKTRKRRRAVPG